MKAQNHLTTLRSISMGDALVLLIDLCGVIVGILSWTGVLLPKNIVLGMGAVVVGSLFAIGQVQRIRRQRAGRVAPPAG